LQHPKMLHEVHDFTWIMLPGLVMLLFCLHNSVQNFEAYLFLTFILNFWDVCDRLGMKFSVPLKIFIPRNLTLPVYARIFSFPFPLILSCFAN
jgi:hypothetical protein